MNGNGQGYVPGSYGQGPEQERRSRGAACGSGTAQTGTACGAGAARRGRPRRGGVCRSRSAQVGPAGRTGQHLPVPVCTRWAHARAPGRTCGGGSVCRTSARGAGSLWPWRRVGCVVRDHAGFRRRPYGPLIRADGGARVWTGSATRRCSGRRCTSCPCGGPGVVGAVRADARTGDGDETCATDDEFRAARKARASCHNPGASGRFGVSFH